MIELIQMLLSWNGILTLVVALYVIDDVFRLGWKTKVRKMVGRDDLFNKDPEIHALEREIERLEENFQTLFTRLNLISQANNLTVPKSGMTGPVPSSGHVDEGPHPLPNQDERPVRQIHHDGQGKTWQSWSDKQKGTTETM